MLNEVICFYSNRFDSATTSIALDSFGIKHKVLVHNDEQADNFKKHGTIKGEMIVTGKPRGLAYQRNAALELMNRGDWAAFLCDDFQVVRGFPKEFIFSKTHHLDINFENQKAFQLLSRKNDVPLGDMFSYFPKLIEMAEENGVHLVGFGLHDNPLNLRRKFGTKGLADGRFWLVKKSNYLFDEKIQQIDDYGWTAENLVRHGKVLILNWLVPFFKRYGAGGAGTLDERLVTRRAECQYLIQKFYPLIQYGNKRHWAEGTHLKIYGAPSNIEKVRRRRGLV